MKMHRFGFLAAAALCLSSPALAEDTITIGFTVSQTGKLNNDSTAQMRGFELWRDEVNAAGGIKAGGKQYKVNFVSYDDESQNTRVQQLYTRLIVAGQGAVPVQPLFVRPGRDRRDHFRAVRQGDDHHRRRRREDLPARQQEPVPGLFARRPVSRRRARGAEGEEPEEPTSPSSTRTIRSPRRSTQATRDLAKKDGLDDRARRILRPATRPTSAPIINKVISAKADALLGGGHYPDGATLAAPAARPEGRAQMGDAAGRARQPELRRRSATRRSASRCPRNGSRRSPSSPTSARPRADFTKTFTDKYKIEPGYHAAGGYTAGLLLQHAIEQAGSIDQAKVAEQLNKMDVTTLFGRTKFSTDPKEHGLQLGHEMVLAQWQKKDGKLVKEVIWPKAAKTADIIY